MTAETITPPPSVDALAHAALVAELEAQRSAMGTRAAEYAARSAMNEARLAGEVRRLRARVEELEAKLQAREEPVAPGGEGDEPPPVAAEG